MRELVILLFISITSFVSAQQFDLSAEVRPRYENKHGYSTLIDDNTDGSNFISQRTRLNFNYKQDKIKLGVSLQNVRV